MGLYLRSARDLQSKLELAGDSVRLSYDFTALRARILRHDGNENIAVDAIAVIRTHQRAVHASAACSKILEAGPDAGHQSDRRTADHLSGATLQGVTDGRKAQIG